MKTVSYKRPRKNFRRTLRPIDLASLGIQTKETLVWSGENQFSLVLNNKLSESLVAKLPNEFSMVDADGDEPDADDDESSEDQSEESPSDSDDDGNDDDESSTGDDPLES
jgi:hypothetical protein